MSLKEELLRKVPLHLKGEPDFHALLEHIKEKEIETKEHLHDYLQKEIQIVERWMEDNKNSAAAKTKTKRDQAVRLDVLKKCFQLTENFLF